MSGISLLHTVDLEHCTECGAGEGVFQTQGTVTVQRLRPNIEHSQSQDLEEEQYDRLEGSEGEMATDRLEQ